MATYAIGDIHGCYRTLQRLIAKIRFDPDRDRILLVGDLVNRGPRSLEVLRWAKSLGPSLSMVLGNHDLRLLALADGVRPTKSKDSLKDCLSAPDSEELLEWLAMRPLLIRHDEYLLVHAGLHPAWNPTVAEVAALEVERFLRSDRRAELWNALRRDDGDSRWHNHMSGEARLAFATNVLTKIRTCTEDGRLCLKYSGPPEEAPDGCRPWFEIPERGTRDVTVIFGHWAAIGCRVEPGIVALDSGCVWGGSLSALRLEDQERFQVPMAD